MGSFGDRPWSWSEQQTFIRKLNKQLGSLRTATVVGGPGEETDPPAIGFFDLYDVAPDSYESQAYKIVRVQSNEEALEFGALTGTENQVYITPDASAHVFSLPQDIHYEATPLFHGLYLKGSDNDRSFLQFIVTGDPDEYVGIQPPEDILSSHTYTLPEDHGVPYEMLWSDSNAILTWGWPEQNVFVGEGAGGVGTRQAGADNNVFIGFGAGPIITSAYDNVVIGSGAGAAMLGAAGNVIIGMEVAADLTTGSGNVILGYQITPTLTSGAQNVVIGGVNTGFRLTTGGGNVFIGGSAGWGVASGIYNTYVGYGAGDNTLGGDYNIAIGKDAGEDFRGGQDNIFIGTETGPIDYGVRFGYGNIWIGADIINQIQLDYDDMHYQIQSGGEVDVGFHYYVFSYLLKDPSSSTGVTWEGVSMEFLEIEITTLGLQTIRFADIPTVSGPLECVKRIIYRSHTFAYAVETTFELERWMFQKVGEIANNTTTEFYDTVSDLDRSSYMWGLQNTMALGDNAVICVGGAATIGNGLERIYWNTPFTVSGEPKSIDHLASSGWGTNKTGGNFRIHGGRGTGAGEGGSVVFLTSVPVDSGSALQEYEEMGRFDPWGFSLPCVISDTEPALTRAGMLWVEVDESAVWRRQTVYVADWADVVIE